VNYEVLPQTLVWRLPVKISRGELTAETRAILLFCLDKGKKERKKEVVSPLQCDKTETNI